MTTPTPQLAERRRLTSRLTIPIVLGTALLASVLGLGAFMLASISKVTDAIPTPAAIAAALAPEPYVEVGPVVVQSIQELAELTTVEMVEYAIIEKGTDQGWLQWARGDTVRLMAVAEIGAGVDLAAISVSDFRVTEDGVVYITVPHAEIHYVAADNEATTILEREKGLLTKGDPQLESEVRRIAETTLLDKAREGGILTQAEASAETVLTNFLIGLGYSDVSVTFSS
jgi:hypothetical protein